MDLKRDPQPCKTWSSFAARDNSDNIIGSRVFLTEHEQIAGACDVDHPDDGEESASSRIRANHPDISVGTVTGNPEKDLHRERSVPTSSVKPDAVAREIEVAMYIVRKLGDGGENYSVLRLAVDTYLRLITTVRAPDTCPGTRTGRSGHSTVLSTNMTPARTTSV